MSRAVKVFKFVAAKRSGLILCQDQLVVAPTDQILRGFVLETTIEKDMVYLWRVVMPLYQPRRRVYLDYSNRIPEGKRIHVNRKAYQESAEAIDSIVAPHIPALQALSHPRDFLKHIEWMLRNDSVRFRFDLALTCHRVGDIAQAASILTALPSEIEQFYEAYDPAMREYMKSGPNPLEDAIRQAARVIESDPAGFSKLLDGWVEKNVEAFGLQAARQTVSS